MKQRINKERRLLFGTELMAYFCYISNKPHAAALVQLMEGKSGMSIRERFHWRCTHMNLSLMHCKADSNSLFPQVHSLNCPGTASDESAELVSELRKVWCISRSLAFHLQYLSHMPESLRDLSYCFVIDSFKDVWLKWRFKGKSTRKCISLFSDLRGVFYFGVLLWKPAVIEVLHLLPLFKS